MTDTFTPADLKRLKEELASSKKSFRLTHTDQNTESMVAFQFVDTHEGKEVMVDAMMFTLEMDYFSNVFEAAVEEALRLKPEFQGADFDAEEGAHIDFLYEVAENLEKEEDFSVSEFLEIEETEHGYISLDVCLNIPEVTEENIESFIRDYKAGTFQADEDLYSFAMEEEEME